jgi:predicted component of type VI protein secretion system
MVAQGEIGTFMHHPDRARLLNDWISGYVAAEPHTAGCPPLQKSCRFFR